MKHFLLFCAFAQVFLVGGARADEYSDLKKLVEINSGSRNIEGVNQVQGIVSDALKKLGFKVDLIPNPAPQIPSGKFLVAVRPGELKDRFITFIMHSDTVFERDSGFLTYEESKDGKRITGPGVGDDKGGIIIVLSGLKAYLAAHPQTRYSLRVISVPNHELSSPGYRDLITGYGKDSVMALAFESTIENGALAESRNGIQKFTLTAKGREAHSGSNFKDGANACVALALVLGELSKLTDLKKGITVNVGGFQGGTEKHNIVCGQAKAVVEIRGKEPDSLSEAIKQADQLISKQLVPSASDGTKVVITKTEDGSRPALKLNSETGPYLKKYIEILTKITGKPAHSEHLGGSTDINFVAEGNPKLISIDCLGAVGGNGHRKDEYIEKDSILARSKALSEYLGWFQ